MASGPSASGEGGASWPGGQGSNCLCAILGTKGTLILLLGYLAGGPVTGVRDKSFIC